MEIATLTRTFAFNGVNLQDPNPQFSVEAVKDFYVAIYPDLLNAEIEGPTIKGATAAYTFKRAVGTKGNDGAEKFEAWGLLELFGHNRLWGRLSEQTIGGCHFIRIDVPEVDAGSGVRIAGYTRFFTQGAIYGMTPTSEEMARAMAQSLRARPVQAYEMPRLASTGNDFED